MIFDKEAPTIQKGFGVTDERITELMLGMQGMDIKQQLIHITSSDGWTDGERFLVMFEAGSRFGQWMLHQHQTRTATEPTDDRSIMCEGGTVH